MQKKIVRIFKIMRYVIFFTPLFIPLPLNALSQFKVAGDNGAKIKVVNWNVQTFFDAQTDGSEYSDFKRSSSGWGRDAYVKRLERLCEAINVLDADVFVMEEIESKGVLYDISNKLASNSWRKKKMYGYGCFYKTPGTSIGCAVLSRHPLSDLKIHSLDIKTENTQQPSLRPLMELTLIASGKKLILYVNHWKSMAGGEAKTEIWRRWQESVLGKNVYDCVHGGLTDTVPAVLCCGDLNCNITKFAVWKDVAGLVSYGGLSKSSDMCNVFLRYIKAGNFGVCGVYSPWILSDGRRIEGGSYYYNKAWNTLDHFFSSGTAKISNFTVENKGPWADEAGIPIGYKVYTGRGYSDHLPVSCTVEF
ncbi:hypothetical protein HRQ91_10190 [Treponema parvum]|uniref:Endonuclease/exonuclease/phosphatase domain-containing protein n=1 Tax=Treponema parvum TaxID=138851 RepID=A0A975IFD4_9SPIR|nr:endonuclease/exonuclease/phosphatase family protein [Treponema parvum]QTQ14803.1 hypothetical protein HRQ91_10190 [Treponema parvum]